MKILVTGGCGYIGTILIKQLLKIGHKVISIDTSGLATIFQNTKT